ncbi:hypothetical protein [Haladaptatus cibarius]|uniref:hypothetical protein n=1 Tax=Haladaptatus cibarius TaxID=453847 RepID=UPI000678C06F|nr:hypothetical protein [Haladaptatus cibarius]
MGSNGTLTCSVRTETTFNAPFLAWGMADDFPGARYSTATLDWARNGHEMLGKHEIGGERLRARLLSRALSQSLSRLLSPFR